jgi:hypothetical protein
VLPLLTAFIQSCAAVPAAPAYPDGLYSRLLVGFARLRSHMYGIPIDRESDEEILRMAADSQSCSGRVSGQVAALALAELR